MRIVDVWRNKKGEYNITERTEGYADDVGVAQNLTEEEMYAMLKVMRPERVIINNDIPSSHPQTNLGL